MGYGTRAVVAAVVVALGAAGQAGAESTPAVDFDLSLSSTDPGSITAVGFHTLYRNPSDSEAEPLPLRKLTIEAPAGTRFDGTAVPACHATDTELRVEGRDACPTASRVGGGSLTVMTGLGPPLDPFPTDATLFNSGDGVIELFSQRGTDATLGIDRTKFTGPGTLTAHPPFTPGGPPDGESAVREVRFTYDAGARPFITTPAKCPPDGRWSSRLTFSTADGHTYRATSTTPCRRASASKPGMRLRVTPRRVAAGTARRFRLRVLSPSPRCTRRATIRFAHRRLRTNRRGRASVRFRLRRVGRRRIVVSKRGCRAASARVHVRR